MTEDDFSYFRGLVRELLGIQLSSAKKELVQSRLRARINALGVDGFSGYRAHLGQLASSDPEWQVFINLLTTNKTDWFRESAHFDYLKKDFLPAWKALGRRKLQVWSAACSTGEEPYTLAAVLEKELGAGYGYEILATDIDTEVLRNAKNGVYPLSRMEQVPENYRNGLFCVGTGEISQWMKVKSQLRQNINFQQINLTRPPYPWIGKFDLIFCRNVLIYFPKEEIQKVIEGMHDAAAPGANLVIGHSESLQNVKVSWNYKKPSIFLKGEK
jgi:chemotaxis methyl-accepting protein methylase